MNYFWLSARVFFKFSYIDLGIDSCWLDLETSKTKKVGHVARNFTNFGNVQQMFRAIMTGPLRIQFEQLFFIWLTRLTDAK
jgi:hypothetical protein